MNKIKKYSAILGLLLFVIIISVLLGLFYPTFLVSNVYSGMITFIVGLFAIWLYIKKKEDSKKDAANILLLEIQNAERIFGQISESVRSGNLPNKFLMPTDSWDQYKYLFVRDFDRDEWDIITEFYNSSKLYDSAVLYSNSLFQKNEEQARVNLLRIPAEYLKKYLEELPEGDEIDEAKLEKIFAKAAKFQETYLSRSELLLYNPKKPTDDAKTALENINRNISQTSIGSKLKKLAELKF
jgi:hypothetical protein